MFDQLMKDCLRYNLDIWLMIRVKIDWDLILLMTRSKSV